MWGMLRKDSMPLSLTPHSLLPKGRGVASGFGPSLTLMGTCWLVGEVTVRALRTGFVSTLPCAWAWRAVSHLFP